MAAPQFLHQFPPFLPSFQGYPPFLAKCLVPPPPPSNSIYFRKVLPTSLIRGGGGPNMLHLSKLSRKGNSERHYWNEIIWPSAHLLFKKNVNFEVKDERNKTILSLLNPFFSSSRDYYKQVSSSFLHFQIHAALCIVQKNHFF